MKLSITLIALTSLVSQSIAKPKGGDISLKKLKPSDAGELGESPSAEACIEALGGSLSRDVLRWAFTSFSLKELNADGWNFEGVPRPDYISATRYWSELCDGSPECDAVCPSEQVVIAGPAAGSDLYEEFKSEILTGAGETFRTTDGDILEPYVGFEDPDDLAEFLETHINAIGILDDATLSKHKPLEDVPVPSPLPSALIAVAHPMTAETCMFALGGLSIAQLRWAFTDWTLKELQADGWDFTGVPTPDFISETRYWSELCEVGQPCESACPARQVKIAGPKEGTALYEDFKKIVLTGEGETFRTVGGHVIDPYVSGSPEEVTLYLKENVDAVGVIKFKKYIDVSDQITASPITLQDGSGDYVTPSWVTIPPGVGYNKGDGSYPLGLAVVAVGAPLKTAKTCTYAISGGGGLTVSQLRWAFTSYTLKELVDNGWAFAGEVPSPDLVSDTRYWSELCDGSVGCVRVCAAKQVVVAGAEPGTAVYDSFAAKVLPGPGETYRTLPILEPYVGGGTDEQIALTVADKLAVTVFDAADVSSPPNSNLVNTVGIKEIIMGEGPYLMPGDDGYVLGGLAVTFG